MCGGHIVFVPRHVLAINDDLLSTIRTDPDRRVPRPALADLNVGAGPVGARAKVDGVAGGSGVDGALDGTKGRTDGARARAGGGDEDVGAEGDAGHQAGEETGLDMHCASRYMIPAGLQVGMDLQVQVRRGQWEGMAYLTNGTKLLHICQGAKVPPTFHLKKLREVGISRAPDMGFLVKEDTAVRRWNLHLVSSPMLGPSEANGMPSRQKFRRQIR